MILSIVLIIGGLTLLCYAFYILAMFTVTNNSLVARVAPPGQHSVTEQALDYLERAFETVVLDSQKFMRDGMLKFITAIIPPFRILTRKVEKSLMDMVAALHGRHNSQNFDRANRSDFMRGMKDHAEESRKNSEAIHDSEVSS
ncbi:MAG: hypothetical protein A2749_00390 [Parcubacteria group bacterium RIFCSPHIGHO2_01_FULL_45_26]|nr:MAG: hypothetical protein A2749_00390 [Parcubacteria group bacterium RIFCSPHIGHO2_01_FULL_45_26]